MESEKVHHDPGLGDPPADEVAELLAEARRQARDRVLAELVERLTERYRTALGRQSPELFSEPPAVSGNARTRRSSADQPRPTEDPMTDRHPSTTRWAWYVYAIVRYPDAAQLNSIRGIDGEPCQILRADGVAAVAARVRLTGFQAVHQDTPDLSEEGWLARAVRAHDHVVHHTFEQTAVLPFRFGCLYPNRQELAHVLATTHQSLLAELDRLDGVAEWTVRAYTAAPDAEPVASRQQTDTDGTSWLHARRDAARSRHDSRQRRSEAIRDIVDELSAHARDTLVRSETGGTGPDDVVSPGAAPRGIGVVATCLVARDAEEEFRRAAQAARDRHSHDVTELTLRGPHPAYHFVQLPEGTSGHV